MNVSYKTELPLFESSPKVSISSESDEIFNVKFIDSKTKEVIKTQQIKSGEIAYGNRQWYTDWKIEILDSQFNLIYEDKFNPTGKVVFIKMDAHALGDNLAWIPYVEEFRKKHNCIVICSTFWNHLFEDVYKNVLFVPPNTKISNVYAQYYIGTFEDLPRCYAPTNHLSKPLQQVATDILGLDFIEVKPLLDLPKSNKEKIVCISEKASSPIKEWKGDWQKIVDYLNDEGYKVIVISKEPTNLKNIIDKTGNISLQNRIQDLVNCEFFMGVSSGLSWLSWACGSHTFLISDFTPPNHEFKDNCTRIYSDNCVKSIKNVENLDSKLSEEDVILAIKKKLLM